MRKHLVQLLVLALVSLMGISPGIAAATYESLNDTPFPRDLTIGVEEGVLKEASQVTQFGEINMSIATQSDGSRIDLAWHAVDSNETVYATVSPLSNSGFRVEADFGPVGILAYEYDGTDNVTILTNSINPSALESSALFKGALEIQKTGLKGATNPELDLSAQTRMLLIGILSGAVLDASAVTTMGSGGICDNMAFSSRTACKDCCNLTFDLDSGACTAAGAIGGAAGGILCSEAGPGALLCAAAGAALVNGLCSAVARATNRNCNTHCETRYPPPPPQN